mmetsp:Transcript_12533/g.36058  ORF Transcript_12533/g.36058 Transcript_12533/m.36058 type:complete len:318 (+) Transcript_12533:847-1800(+)
MAVHREEPLGGGAEHGKPAVLEVKVVHEAVRRGVDRPQVTKDLQRADLAIGRQLRRQTQLVGLARPDVLLASLHALQVLLVAMAGCEPDLRRRGGRIRLLRGDFATSEALRLRAQRPRLRGIDGIEAAHVALPQQMVVCEEAVHKEKAGVGRGPAAFLGGRRAIAQLVAEVADEAAGEVEGRGRGDWRRGQQLHEQVIELARRRDGPLLEGPPGPGAAHGTAEARVLQGEGTRAEAWRAGGEGVAGEARQHVRGLEEDPGLSQAREHLEQPLRAIEPATRKLQQRLGLQPLGRRCPTLALARGGGRRRGQPCHQRRV